MLVSSSKISTFDFSESAEFLISRSFSFSFSFSAIAKSYASCLCIPWSSFSFNWILILVNSSRISSFDFFSASAEFSSSWFLLFIFLYSDSTKAYISSVCFPCSSFSFNSILIFFNCSRILSFDFFSESTEFSRSWIFFISFLFSSTTQAHSSSLCLSCSSVSFISTLILVNSSRISICDLFSESIDFRRSRFLLLMISFSATTKACFSPVCFHCSCFSFTSTLSCVTSSSTFSRNFFSASTEVFRTMILPFSLSFFTSKLWTDSISSCFCCLYFLTLWDSLIINSWIISFCSVKSLLTSSFSFWCNASCNNTFNAFKEFILKIFFHLKFVINANLLHLFFLLWVNLKLHQTRKKHCHHLASPHPYIHTQHSIFLYTFPRIVDT